MSDYEQLRKALKQNPTKGKRSLFIGDFGGEHNGRPLSVSVGDKVIVRQGGMYPYEWDEKISESESRANGYLIEACDPDTIESLLDKIDILETKFKMATLVNWNLMAIIAFGAWYMLVVS